MKKAEQSETTNSHSKDYIGFDFFYGKQWNNLEIQHGDNLEFKVMVNGKKVRITNAWVGSVSNTN